MTQFNRSASVNITAKGGALIPITRLRIVGTINKTDNKDPNTSTIKIYNMTENLSNIIRATGDIIQVNAGYLDGDGEELILLGTIKSVDTFPDRPEVVTTIKILDGKSALDNAKVTINQTGGTGAKSILNKILATFDIGNNLKTISFSDINYQNGFAFAGMSKSALTKVTKFLKLNWSIQNNEINLVPFDSNNGVLGVSISPRTGLIGSPQKIDSTTRKDAGKSDVSTIGWKFDTLLSPKINPQGQLELTSKEIPKENIFTVTSVNHSFDTHGRDWISSVEVKE